MSENTTRSKYGIQAATFQEAIHVGRLNKGQTEFLDKENATDMVLFAVADYVRRHFDGGLTMDFTDPKNGAGFTLAVTVTDLAVKADEPELAERR